MNTDLAKPLTIPLVEDNTSLDCVPRLYRRALLNTLMELKPKNCLEFGSFCLESAYVFAYYFEKYQPEGRLITVDIALWNRKYKDLYNVYSIMAYPHSLDVQQYHGDIQIYYADWQEKISLGGDSLLINRKIINKKMQELDIHYFDFIFLDSDHTRSGFIKDLYITTTFTKYDSYILIDDIHDINHEQRDIYHNELKPKNPGMFYEFDDWQPNPGMGLIRKGDLVL